MDLVLDGTALEPAAALVAVVAGFVVAVWASQRAVRHTTEIAATSRIPRFIIGFTLLAVGTDLPEIANSIVASITDHGDLNVGDSVGSAATQLTLVLGALPIIGAATFVVSRRRTLRVGLAIVGSLLLGVALMSDGFISRLDAFILFGTWIFGTAMIFGPSPRESQGVLPAASGGRAAKLVAVLAYLGIVAGASVLAVWGMSVIAEWLSVPEYLVAFFLASIGTSLPELIVDISAIRQGQHELAIGDVFGSSFVDVTLSIAAGPLLVPVAVTSSIVTTGSLTAIGATMIVVGLLSWRKRHDWRSGVALLVTYSLFYVVAFALA